MSSINTLISKIPIIGGGGLGTLVFSILIGFGGLAVLGAIIYYLYRRKKWNLLVDFKIPRNLQEADDKLAEDENVEFQVDGFVNAERGKGMYDPKNGVVWVKRPWMAKSPIKPFDIKRYIQGKNILTVVQTGSNEYKPVLPRSYLNVKGIDGEAIENAVLLKTNLDNTESRAWKNQFERQAKEAFSIKNLLKEYGAQITMGIILLFNFIGFAILYTKIA